jgi:cytochrome c-type biogenesis protein CcmE
MPDGDAPELRTKDREAEARDASDGREDETEGGRGVPAWALGVALLALSVGVAWVVLSGGGGDPFTYSVSVTQVVSTPAEYAGRDLRVEGMLTDGSVRFRDEPCEWRFTIEEGEHVIPVRFSQCIVPDTFRDHMDISVVVQGQMEDGTFIASEVIPRCPSRYDMDERASRGERMPHASPIRETPPPPES